jgi:SAM-dependent methyltransferase
MLAPSLPYPPLALANRVGSLEHADEPMAYYDEIGRRTRDEILSRLPDDWSFAGKSVLDFGCGAGRTLRHFAAEAAEAEIWGCDLDEPSVRWLQDNLCPPFQVFLNDEDPPLGPDDSSFDLVWGISVFTHLSDNWSSWLVELHRILDSKGLLYLTFMGRGMSQIVAGEPWDEDQTGMNVLKYGQSWDLGGPMVIHSPWWIEEHWGRGFEILSLSQDGFACPPSTGHGSVLMRKRDVPVTPELFEQVNPGNPRELLALMHNVAQLKAESQTLRTESGHFNSLLSQNVVQREQLEAQLVDLQRRLEAVEGSRSWALTRPMRSIAHRVRAAKR